MISGAFRGYDRAPLASRKRLIRLAFVVFCMAAASFLAQAQDTSQQPPVNPNKQEAPPKQVDRRTIPAPM